MTAHIYTGGREVYPSLICERPLSGELTIAADSGIALALELGVTPTVIVGDFDSSDPPTLEGVRIITFPAEKDDTDTMLAVKYALEQGCRDITIYGGLGGRLDHTLANMGILEYIALHGGRGALLNGQNRVRYASQGAHTVEKGYPYISVVPLSRELTGVTLSGFYYPLENAVVSRAMSSLSISNRLVDEAETGEIVIGSGEALIIESRDM